MMNEAPGVFNLGLYLLQPGVVSDLITLRGPQLSLLRL